MEFSKEGKLFEMKLEGVCTVQIMQGMSHGEQCLSALKCLPLHYECFSHFVIQILARWFIKKKKKSLSDQVFGSNLANLCQRENSTVPKFVKLCIEHVEEYGKKMIF